MTALRNTLLLAGITFVTSTGLGPCVQAETGPTQLPPDVIEFGGRRISCLELSKAARDDSTVNTMRSLKCSDIEDNEQSLRLKYADNPAILATLDSFSGHWVKVVKRLPVKIPIEPADVPSSSDR